MTRADFETFLADYLDSMPDGYLLSNGADLLNISNASRGTTIDARKVADLPLLGKNPYTFAYHAAGVLHINPQGSITDRPYDNGGVFGLPEPC